MKIEEFEVVGLLKSDNIIRGTLSSDLNILTGRNGAGKTTILKLLWYVVSGNIFEALKEINFQRVTVTTDQYTCVVHRTGNITCRVEMITEEGEFLYEDDPDEISSTSAEDLANPVLISHGSSLFFPTFRRLEGGFGLTRYPNLRYARRLANSKNDIEEALAGISRRLSNEPHTFVSSISTVDIVNVVLQKFGALSSLSNEYQQLTGEDIIGQIRTYKADTGSDDAEEIKNANNLIDEIKSKIEVMEEKRKQIMLPIEAIRLQVQSLFRHSGISLNSKFSFGDAANAINSDALSAGEKQMLSFISYNAFYEDSVIFIDEPELSLHVDWQRQLFPILLNQQSTNQFIIATHSPFIYAKFPEKEIIVDPDKGDGKQ